MSPQNNTTNIINIETMDEHITPNGPSTEPVYYGQINWTDDQGKEGAFGRIITRYDCATDQYRDISEPGQKIRVYQNGTSASVLVYKWEGSFKAKNIFSEWVMENIFNVDAGYRDPRNKLDSYGLFKGLIDNYISKN